MEMPNSWGTVSKKAEPTTGVPKLGKLKKIKDLDKNMGKDRPVQLGAHVVGNKKRKV